MLIAAMIIVLFSACASADDEKVIRKISTTIYITNAAG